MGRRKQKMSFQDAMDMTPDDLPDGAFFAMAHELAGLEYGDGFAEMVDHGPQEPSYRKPVFKCPKKLRTKLEAFGILKQNDAYHWQVRHRDTNAVLADWWPHVGKFRINNETKRGEPKELLSALQALTGKSS